MRRNVHLVDHSHVTVEILLLIKSQIKEIPKKSSPESVHARTRPIQDCRSLSNAPGQTFSLISALDVGGWLTPSPGRSTPGKETW